MADKLASLEQENSSLREKIASMERESEISDIAQNMEENGLNADMTFEEKVAHIRRHEDLSRVKAAISMASTGNIKIADVADYPGSGVFDSLTSFCLGGE